MVLKNSIHFVIFLFCLMCSTASFASPNINDAYIALEQKLAQNPSDIQTKLELAFVFTQGFEYERAAKLYEEIIAAGGDNFAIQTELCFLYTELNRADRARTACTKVIELRPDQSLSYDNLGLSLLKLGRPAEAAKPFLQALALDKTSVAITYHFAQSLMSLGEFATARDILEGVLENPQISDTDKGLVNHGLYLVYDRLKDYPKAYEAIKRTSALSQNTLFLGKLVLAYIKAHQVVFFVLVSGIVLSVCRYLGERLNRFLKNEQ